jgi:hypothetical protein
MKKIQSMILMAVFAIAITTAFAFRPTEKNAAKHTDDYFFVYSGPSTDIEDYLNPDYWSEALTEDPGGCNSGSLPCVVQSTIDNKEDFLLDIDANGKGVVEDNDISQRH